MKLKARIVIMTHSPCLLVMTDLRTRAPALYSYSLALSSKYFFLCRQKFHTSSLRFRLAWFGFMIMWYISDKQSLHCRVIGLKAWVFSKIFHVRMYSWSWSLSPQICSLRVVSVLLSTFLKELLCAYILFLNRYVPPVYVTVSSCNSMFSWFRTPFRGARGVTSAP